MSAALTGALAGTSLCLTLVAAQVARSAHHRAAARARLGGGVPPAQVATTGPRLVLHAPEWAHVHLDDAALPVPVDVAWTAWCCGPAPAALVGAAAGGPGAGLVAGAAWVVAGALVLATRRGAAGRLVEQALPDALDGVARALRGGATTSQALAEVATTTSGRLGRELQRAMAEVGAGSGLEEALVALQARRPERGVRLTVAALLLGAEAGGAHARALEGVAASVRAHLGVAAEVRALGSQARLSALVIAAAPVGFTGLAVGTDRTSATFLLRTPLGLSCLALGLALDAVGAWWMHRLAQVDA